MANDMLNVEPLRVHRKVWLAALAGITTLVAVAISAAYLWNWLATTPEADGQPPPDAAARTASEQEPTLPPAPPDPDGGTLQSSSQSVSPPKVSLEPLHDTFQQQQDAVAEARLARLLAKAQALRQQWNRLDEQAAQWESRIDRLLTGDAGRQIAADAALVDQFQVLLDKERPSETEIAAWGERMEILLEPLDGISSPDLNPAFLEEIDTLAQEIAAASRQFEQHERMLDALLRSSESQSPADDTLQAALDARAQELAQAELESVVAANEEARQERLAQQERQAQEEAEAKREYERLKREALSPEVLTLLAPLITPDYTQPRQITGLLAHGEKTAKKEPVSFSRLQSLGVLDPTESGLKKLALLNTRKWTRRPRWKMDYEAPEPNLWSERQFEMIRKTQEYLNKYGPILVQEGKLAP